MLLHTVTPLITLQYGTTHSVLVTIWQKPDREVAFSVPGSHTPTTPAHFFIAFMNV